jgi:hypothetical protein
MMIARAAKQLILAWHQQISDWHGSSTAGAIHYRTHARQQRIPYIISR